MSELSFDTLGKIPPNDPVFIGQGVSQSSSNAFDNLLQRASGSYSDHQNSRQTTLQSDNNHQPPSTNSTTAQNDQPSTAAQEDDRISPEENNHDQQDSLEHPSDENAITTVQDTSSEDDQPKDQDEITLSTQAATVEARSDQNLDLDSELNLLAEISTTDVDASEALSSNPTDQTKDIKNSIDLKTTPDQTDTVALKVHKSDTQQAVENDASNHSITIATTEGHDSPEENSKPVTVDQSNNLIKTQPGDHSEQANTSKQNGPNTAIVLGEKSQKAAANVTGTNNSQEIPSAGSIDRTSSKDTSKNRPKRQGEVGTKKQSAADSPANNLASAIALTNGNTLSTASELANSASESTSLEKVEAGLLKTTTNSESRSSQFNAARFHHSLTPGSTQDATSAADELNQADQMRFIQRVSKAFQTAHSRGDVVKLRLSPPELGSLTMEVSLNEGTLTAKIETDTPAARNLILENLHLLRERLDEQGIKVEKFDVDVQQRSPDDLPQQQDQKQTDGQQEQASANQHESDELLEENLSVASESEELSTGKLNIVI